MAVDPITGASHVKTRHDPVHKVLLVDQNGNPYDASVTGQVQPVTLIDANGRTLQMDASTHALTTVGYEHHEIHSGSHYYVGGYQDLAINEVLDFTLLTPNTTKWLHWTWRIGTESETNWLVYEGAVATNPLANSITPINNNRNSSNTSGATLKYELQADLATANADTNIGGASLKDSGISGSGRDSGAAIRTHEIILKQNTLYCLRAIATAAGYINFNMQWYEHTDKG